MLRLSVVVVLYKKRFSESSALQTLICALKDMEFSGFSPTVYVWNNSPGFSPKLDHPSVVWMEGENTTLPIIYNHVAKLAFDAGASALMISDDDTDYAQYDFKSNLTVVSDFINDESKAGVVGCFIPRIQSAGTLVSPGGRYFFKGHLLTHVQSGLVQSKNLLAINSGTIITKACYERIQPLYDERLKFYGTDTDFFVRYENFYEYIYVLDSVIDHSLSEHTQESSGRAYFRWQDNIRAMRFIFEHKSFAFKFCMRFYHLMLKVKLFLKFRDGRFLKI